METRTVRRMLLPALMILALASSASAQAPQDTPRDLTAIKADLEQIKADLAAVKSQLRQLRGLLAQRPAQGGAPPSGPGRTSVAEAPMRGRADAPARWWRLRPGLDAGSTAASADRVGS